MFSKAGFRLASGGGTGYSSAHGLLTCDPFTGGIWVEFLLVGKHPPPMSGKKADGPMCTAVCSEEHCSGERGEVVPCRSLVWWRCRHPWWGCSFQAWVPQDSCKGHSDHHILSENKAGSSYNNISCTPKPRSFWGEMTLEVFPLKPPKNVLSKK